MPNTKVSKQVIRRLHKSWVGYKQAHFDWTKHPDKYLGEPRLPRYKDKTKGRYMIVEPSETVSKPPLRKGIVKLTDGPIEFNSGLTQVHEVRVIPRSGCYVVEIVYTQEELPFDLDEDKIAGIDLGLSNLVTLTANQSGFPPLLIKGGALKAINTYYNKKKAKLQSSLENSNGAKVSRRILALTHKRNCRVDNYLHTTSRRVIDWCVHHKIKTLVVGKNQGWKNSINISKRNNQQFVGIPHAKLIDQIAYKGKLLGIKVVVTEESYTSKSSFLHNDPLPSYGEHSPKFSGKRVHLRLYISDKGIINADVNGSLNIIRKVKPNVLSDYGLKGLPFSPVTGDPLRTHDFLQFV